MKMIDYQVKLGLETADYLRQTELDQLQREIHEFFEKKGLNPKFIEIKEL